MKTYKHVMVMGAGAVGGYFGGRMAERTSARVTLIARGAHLKAIQQNGLWLNSIDGNTTIKAIAYKEPAIAEQLDLILFTVKSYDTEQAIEQIKPVVNKQTQILTLQNGIENYPRLVNAFGEERVIQGFCKIGAEVASPGIIEHRAFGAITAGEKKRGISLRLRKLQKLCKEANITVHLTDEINRKVWLKFAWNAVFNMVTAVGGVTVEKIFEDAETKQLCYKLFEEIQQVSRAEGVTLNDDDKHRIIESAAGLSGFKTSTYQDRIKGKKMEYEAFTGAIVRLADKHGLETPHNRTLYALLKLISSR